MVSERFYERTTTKEEISILSIPKKNLRTFEFLQGQLPITKLNGIPEGGKMFVVSGGMTPKRASVWFSAHQQISWVSQGSFYADRSTRAYGTSRSPWTFNTRTSTKPTKCRLPAWFTGGDWCSRYCHGT